jgi:hypothetical protein
MNNNVNDIESSVKSYDVGYYIAVLFYYQLNKIIV